MVRNTSIIAYDQLKSEGKDLTQKQRILKLINEENKPMSRKEISAVTGYEINAISGRVNTLLKEGKIKEVAKRKCKITKKTIKPVASLTWGLLCKI